MSEQITQSHSDLTRRQVIRALIFLLLFTSGACALSYQLVWTRLAYASFGIITPVLSVVISVFMLGLSLGSWLAGKYVKVLAAKTKQSALLFYGIAEALIAVGGLLVPYIYRLGADM